MCVIIAKSKGVKMPAIATLKMAHFANPHGIGIVSSNGIYWRGLDFDEFLRVLKGVGKDDACIIHFRFATHGSHKVSNCHPFRHHNLYFAHNGILPVVTHDDMTDSETVFRDKLIPVYDRSGINSHDFTQAVLENIGASKFAFMDNGEVYLWGRFYKEHGVYFSNFNFRVSYRFGY